MEIIGATGVKEIIPGVGGVEGYIRFHFEQEEEEKIQVIHFDCLSQKKKKKLKLNITEVSRMFYDVEV